MATVVPNPSLSGTCAWDTRDNKFNGGSVASLKTPTPTIDNLYGRTCEGPFFTVSGTRRPPTGTIAGGLPVDAFDHDGQTMTNIAISATCGSITATPVSCDNIIVWDPNKPEYTMEIGTASTTYSPSTLVSGVAYTVLSVGSPCNNVKFATTGYGWNGETVIGTSVKVNNSTPVKCTDNNNNCSNLVVSPKPAVGDVIIIEDAEHMGTMKCDSW